MNASVTQTLSAQIMFRKWCVWYVTHLKESTHRSPFSHCGHLVFATSGEPCMKSHFTEIFRMVALCPTLLQRRNSSPLCAAKCISECGVSCTVDRIIRLVCAELPRLLCLFFLMQTIPNIEVKDACEVRVSGYEPAPWYCTLAL